MKKLRKQGFSPKIVLLNFLSKTNVNKFPNFSQKADEVT